MTNVHPVGILVFPDVKLHEVYCLHSHPPPGQVDPSFYLIMVCWTRWRAILCKRCQVLTLIRCVVLSNDELGGLHTIRGSLGSSKHTP